MDIVILILNILVLLSIAIIGLLWKKTLSKYLSEKGKNIATKEDIGEITNKVEEVKSTYLIELEKVKIDLLLSSKKQTILLDEKIRVFKILQQRLVAFKKYCEATIGDIGNVSEFHPNLSSLSKEIDKSALLHISAIREIIQEDFIFLSNESRKLISNLLNKLSMMPNIEIYIFNIQDSEEKYDEDIEQMENFVDNYKSAMLHIDECLMGLYEDLEFTGKR